MSKRLISKRLISKRFVFKRLVLAMVLGLGATVVPSGPSQAELNQYCQLSQAEASAKEALRRSVFEGNQADRTQYETLIRQQATRLQDCRRQNWPDEQAVWIRLYPCDLQPGILEAVLDRIVNLGYNHVYVEVFYSGQVLLPEATNSTAWSSVVQSAGYERRDLLAEAIEKGHDRGLKVSAWMFTLNFGYPYGQRADRRQALARNGRGQDTLAYAMSGAISNPEEVFVDPYSLDAKDDYQRMVMAIAQRRPDGILFDYVRYPRGVGTASVVSNVGDLWIYGASSQQAFFRRAMNNKGLELMRRYLSRGYLTAGDVSEVDRLFPNEGEPLWQTRVTPPPSPTPLPPEVRQPILQNELWFLSVAHAVQGVIDFLDQAARGPQQQGLPTGAVFFPGGNRTVGERGFDSRLQYWDRFPTWMSWHPMAYAVCGNTGCILDEIRRVLSTGGAQATAVKPAIAGVWGQSTPDRPSLELQMQAIRRGTPQVTSVSHFAYSWQDPEFDRSRKFCQLR